MTNQHALALDFDDIAGEPETLILGADPDDPEYANVVAEQAMKTEQPEMADAPPGQVELPGGWVSPEGDLVTKGMVSELTGLAEEKLARIDPVANLPLLLHTIVEMGLDNLGGHQPTPGMLKDLLAGDRDALILGIRIATYGDELEMHITCPDCGTEEDLALELSKDVPVKKMETPSLRRYDVTLRNGRTAVVQPATCGIVDDAWDAKKSAAEIKTSILERCILTIDGMPVGHQEAQSLGLGDRKTVMDFLEDVQPGPDYGGVRLPCGSCGREFHLRLDLTDLFR